MTKPRFNWRHQYDTERDEKEGALAAIECRDESLTQQHFTEDADLNTIARRFGFDRGPIPPGTPPDLALYRDTTHDPDLRTILDLRRDALNRFAELPFNLRKRFHHNPGELWDFVNDPDNAEEALRLGLLTHLDTATADQDKTTAPATTPPRSVSTAPRANSTTSSSAGDGGNRTAPNPPNETQK